MLILMSFEIFSECEILTLTPCFNLYQLDTTILDSGNLKEAKYKDYLVIGNTNNQAAKI